MDAAAATSCETLTIVLRGVRTTIPYAPGDTIVQAAFDAGLRPPISCLAGQCATCMARIETGTVEMLGNDVLSPAEIARGYVLTCQGVPTAREVTVVYED